MGCLVRTHLNPLMEWAPRSGPLRSKPLSAFQTGRPEALAPGEPVRLVPHPSCAACPGGAGPCYAWRRAGAAATAVREGWPSAGDARWGSGVKMHFKLPTKSQPPFGHTAPVRGGPLCCMRRSETPTYRDWILHACGLGNLRQDYGIAQAFKGLEGPLPFAFLLSAYQALIPLLLIKRPLQEQMRDDHH